jgi:1,4-alpha-glucan branching enzyme
MLKKSYSKTGNACRVTFKLPAEVGATEAALCGEFNGWDETCHPMKKLKDGSFSITLSLEPGQSYRFRYRLDGQRWENDWEADAYLPNQFASEDSVVAV